MIQVRFVNLSELGIRPPANSVRMVIVQPHLPTAVFTSDEPYKLTEHARPRQLEILKRTIEIASGSGDTNGTTNFTILPEYCIPGLEGVEFIEERLGSEDWANGTVLIGGLDGITKEEYEALLIPDSSHHDEEINSVSRVADDQWLNCSITWVKSSDGQVLRWIQPKLCPAWPEASSQNRRMFKGKSIYLFRGQRTNGEAFVFGTLVCFDWIARNPSPIERILEATDRVANDAQLPLTWLFVIQHNKKPSHYDFLSNVVEFFRPTSHPNATRTNTCIVFANTAGLAQPGYCAEYGSTSLILGPHTSFMTEGARPTLSHEGFRYREQNSEILRSAQCRDIFFRERGECIHVLDQINPSTIQAGAPGRAYAVDNGEVHATVGAGHVLAPGAGVPLSIKWANDVLDQTNQQLPDHAPALTRALERARATVIHKLRRIDSRHMTYVVRLATPSSQCNLEAWGADESAGLRHVVRTLGILGAGDKLESVGLDMVHGVVSFAGAFIDVVAVQGVSHQSCIEHLENCHSKRQRSHLLLVSRDTENTHWDPRHGSFLKVGRGSPEAERKITDAARPTYHAGYQDVLHFLSQANGLSDIERGIRASAG